MLRKGLLSFSLISLVLAACSSSETSLDKREIPSTPLEGTIATRAFAPKFVGVEYDATHAQWFIKFRDDASGCNGATDAGPGSLVVTIGALPAATGTFQIAAGDGHGASFQVGVFGAAGQADVKPAESGKLRIDTWSETPGETVTGGIILSNEESEIRGAFTATVCPPR